MKSRKKRRESGRKHNKIYDPEHGFYNRQYWDDWNDYRDGYRDVYSDMTKIKPKYLSQEHWGKMRDRNKKILKKIKIREARKKSIRNQ